MELESKDVPAAVSDLEAAVRLSPNNGKFHEELADAYKAALRPADAQREMETSKMLMKRTQTNTSTPAAATPNQ
jgi:hypothetical protein